MRQIKTQNQLTATVEEDQLLTIEDASSYLHLAVQSIYGLVHRAQIPYMKKGKRLYFSKQELTVWLKKGRRKTAEEIATEAKEYTSKKGKGGVR